MTLEEAIKNFEQEIGEFEGFKKIHAVTHEDYAHIEKTRQLAEWLRELKELRIENKALKNRCADFEHGAPCRYCPLDCEFRKHEFEVRQHRESHQTSSDCGMAERIEIQEGE